MSRRVPLDIKKKILQLLKEKEMSLRELESKVNTNYQTIKNQIKELEFFEKVIVIKHKKNKINGKPYTTIQLKR